MSKVKFTGILPALITPLDRNGRVNRNCVKALMDHCYAAGVDGFYITGGTGEGPLLSAARRREMAEAAVEANAGRGKIIIHTGSINSEEALELTRHAARAGADGVSSVPPSFYFRYNLAETIDFYKRMAGESGLPLLIYASSQAGTGNIDINAMMAELLKIETVCGAKDTRGSYYAMWELKQLNNGDINVINGPDEMLLGGLAAGADGGIGSTYALMPEKFVRLYRLFRAGDLAGARAVQNEMNRIISVMIRWADGNIIRACKESLKLSGFDAGNALYPAQSYPPEKLARFKAEMEAAGYRYN